MKRWIVGPLIIVVTYFLARRTLDELVWRQFEREVRREGRVMSQVISDYRTLRNN